MDFIANTTIMAKKRAAKKKTAKKKSRPKKSAKTKKKAPRKWSRKIKTVSTKPPPGLFKKDADTVAETMASKKVSPGGIGSGIQMVQMYINRAGKNLDSDQKDELELAKRKLQSKLKKQKGAKSPTKKKKAKRRAQ
jgi:hypothetical protein